MGTERGSAHERGFAGLDAMVSNVASPAAVPSAPDRCEGQARPLPKVERAQPILTGTVKPGGSRIKWWVFGGAAVALLGWVAATDQTANHSAGRTSGSAPVAAEVVPPVGTGVVLNRSQIRYCISEEFRLAAWYDRVNTSSDRSVDAYNRAVDNYNSRCANFRYSGNLLEQVRAEVEANRAALQREGMARAAANP